MHPGDKDAEARFKEVASAYAIVGDEAKRALFDNGQIDASGAELRPQPQRPSYRQHAEAQPEFKYDRGWQGGALDDELLAEIFGRRDRADVRGADVHYTMPVEFLEAINGTRKRVVMADGKALDIVIPPGLTDGQTLRLRGQGQAGMKGVEPGDVLVDVQVSHTQSLAAMAITSSRFFLSPLVRRSAEQNSTSKQCRVVSASHFPKERRRAPGFGCGARVLQQKAAAATTWSRCASFYPKTPTTNLFATSSIGRQDIPMTPKRKREMRHDR